MAGLSFMQRRGDKLGFRKRMPKELAGLPAPKHVRSAFPTLVNLKSGLFKRIASMRPDPDCATG